ncbi:hypothetical protein SKAU_G00083850 [Synaphobranchus kaupii]|uniref:Uncharacterized protein n=1 Tax=Synaphobranchus kaupii TaxID=118154 RepID=A0A9Q1J4R3_SYNKA|nr:hypothetical protein SKAU_G00083850 [Synaphobranchus kaupii]
MGLALIEAEALKACRADISSLPVTNSAFKSRPVTNADLHPVSRTGKRTGVTRKVFGGDSRPHSNNFPARFCFSRQLTSVDRARLHPSVSESQAVAPFRGT